MKVVDAGAQNGPTSAAESLTQGVSEHSFARGGSAIHANTKWPPGAERKNLPNGDVSRILHKETTIKRKPPHCKRFRWICFSPT